jgi:hypothetical protein
MVDLNAHEAGNGGKKPREAYGPPSLLHSEVIMLIGITFAELTWVLLYGRAGGIGRLIMLLGALSYPVALVG